MAAEASSGLFGTRLRRRRLLGTAVVGGGAALVAACGGNKSRSDTGATGTGTDRLATVTTGQAVPGATEQVKRGGTFTIRADPPRSLDPHFDTFPANTIVTNNVHNSLLTFTPDLTQIEPELATAMPEQVDELTFVFKLHQGVKYHNVPPANGREMTADDVKYSIDRQMTNNPGKFQHAYFFLDRVDRIEAVDKYTVRFVNKKPYAPFLSYVASPWTQVILRELVEQNGDLTQKIVGTGPFIFEEWQKDVQHRLRRNPDYWRKDTSGGALPYIDTVLIKIINDPNSAQAQFLNKDLLATGIQFNFLNEVKNRLPKANYRSIPSQFPRQMRTPPYDDKIPHKKPFNDIRVRQALIQAVNKKEVLDLVYSGDGVTWNGPILPIYPNWALKEDPAKFDPDDAKKLLVAAGYPNGWDDEMIYSQNQGADIPSQIGEVLQRQLARIGVRITLKPMDSSSYYNKNYAWDYTLSHHQPLNNPDPDENLASYFGPNATFYRWGNKEIHALIDKQAQTLDVNERKKIVEEAQRKIVLDYPMSFMFTNNNHFFTWPQVKGWFFPNDLYNGRLERVWLDPAAG